MKRIVLFLATNLAVVLLLSVVASVLGVDQFLTQNGLDLETLLWFSLLMGFGGSFISLLISKQIALWSTGAHIIKSPEGAHEQWLVRTGRGIGPGFYFTVFVGQIVLGMLASMIVMWFSRRREFRADAGSARLLGTPRPMIGALMRLGGMQPGALPQSMAASGISGAPGWMALFSSHPPIEERIQALRVQA